MPGTFTLTPEQLALREARRLKKEKAATNAGVSSSYTPPSSFLNHKKGQILPRPWLAVQDGTNATHTAKIMTWNVRNFFTSVYTALDRHMISPLIPLLSALSPMPRP